MKDKEKLVPKRRFKEFLDAPAWEQRKLGELGDIHGNGVDKKTNVMDKRVRLLNYMDVYNQRKINEKNAIELMEVTATLKEITENSVLKNDVFLTPTSETASDIGRVLVVESNIPNLVYSYHLMRYRPYADSFHHLFPMYLLMTDFVRKQMVLEAQGVQRFVLNKRVFENLVVYICSYNEQKRVSECLRGFDNLITLHQCE